MTFRIFLLVVIFSYFISTFSRNDVKGKVDSLRETKESNSFQFANRPIPNCRSGKVPDAVFRDVSSNSGVSFDRDWAKVNRNKYDLSNTLSGKIDKSSGGVVAADFDGDGFEDLLFTSGDGVYLFRNLGNFKFQDVTSESGISSQENLVGALAFDFDNDGSQDVLVYGQRTKTSLYKNIGGMRFVDVSTTVGLDTILDSSKNSFYGATVGDYDLDGWLDIYLLNYDNARPGRVFTFKDNTNSFPNYLLHNEKGGKFTDTTYKAGVADTHWSLAAIFFDYDQDGYPDLLVANDFGNNTLYHNDGSGSFTKILTSLSQTHNFGMGIVPADYSNSGRTDVFITGIYMDKSEKNKEGNLLFQNQSTGGFTNISASSGVQNGGWGWGGVPIDFNNDGLVDIATVSGQSMGSTQEEIVRLMSKDSLLPRAFLYRNLGNYKFEDVSCQTGFQISENGRGLVKADLNNDGFQDLVVNELRRSPKIFQNLGGPNNWLEIKLEGKESNRNGIGSKIWIDSGSTHLFTEVVIAGTYNSSSSALAHFGLFTVGNVDVKVQWPSGKRQELHNISANQILLIKEQ